MNNGVDAVHKRAREAARLEGRAEGSADARDAVLGELMRLGSPRVSCELLRTILTRVLDELVTRHAREHATALERFVTEARGSWGGEKEKRP